MKFGLESVVTTGNRYASHKSAMIQREVERLIATNRQDAAFDMYQTDNEITQLNRAQFAVVFPVDTQLTIVK